MATPTFKFIPNLDDIFAGGVAGVVASFNNQSVGREATEQIASGLAADNLANYLTISDEMVNADTPVPINEGDTLTGVVRAGFSAYKGRSNQQVLMDGIKGLACRLIGRELRKSLMPAAAPAS